MNDAQGDAAVGEYAEANNNRVVILNKSGVFLNRNDRGRQNPIRSQSKNSHDEGVPVLNTYRNDSRSDYAAHSYDNDNAYHQGPGNVPYPGSYGISMPVDTHPNANAVHPPPQGLPFSNSYNMPAPAAYSYPVPVPHGVFEGHAPSVAPPAYPPFQSFQLSTKVLLENLPLSATPDDISACLYHYSLNVSRCTIEYDNDPKATWCYAHIDLVNPEESSRCVALAQQSLLEYRGRILTASIGNNLYSPQYPVPQIAPPIVNHHYHQPPPAPQNTTPIYHQPLHNTPPAYHPNSPSTYHQPRNDQRYHQNEFSGRPRGGPGFRRGGGSPRHRHNRRDRPY
jgi:hypothetical protein